MINVGIVGFGLSGRYLQAPFFLANPKFSLQKIVTSQELPKHLFPEIERVSSVDDLLSDPAIQLISICSPNSTHFEYAKRALEAGKHVLIEKPITARLNQAEELYELANKRGFTLCVFQNRRFDSDFLTVQQVIKSGVLGDVVSFEAHFDRFKPVLNAKAWKETPTDANGILYDLGAHLIDQAIVLFGKPDTCYGEVYIQRENSNIDDAFNLNLSFGKVKVNLKSSLLVKDQGPKYIVHGTLGSFTKYGMDVQEDHLVSGLHPGQAGFGLESSQFYGKLKTQISGLEIDATVDTLQGNWAYLFDNLAEAILRGTPLNVQPEQILEQLKIYESIKYNDNL
jgi:scyllo-inositol 2-dehydrogenase (NADP+)